MVFNLACSSDGQSETFLLIYYFIPFFIFANAEFFFFGKID